MAKQERTRKSAPQNRVKSFVTSNEPIYPSMPLDFDEQIRFDAIIDSRERDTWVPNDVAVATHLAQIEVERERVRAQYMEEGHTIKDRGGKSLINPLFTAYNTLFNQAQHIRKDLGLSASQKGISGHKQKKRNQQDVQAAEKIASIGSLIARPNVKTE